MKLDAAFAEGSMCEAAEHHVEVTPVGGGGGLGLIGPYRALGFRVLGFRVLGFSV